MSFYFNIRSRTLLLGKLSLLASTSMILAACVSSSTTNSFGTRLLAVGPSAFNCPASPNLDLKIVQNVTGDAVSILCPNGVDDCTAPTQASGRAVVRQGQTVRWTLANANTNQEFLIIFQQDKSPAHSKNNRGTNIVASERGQLCLKVNGRAEKNNNGFPYHYSVFVKYCAGIPGCTPKVLDPIMYVR